MKKGKKKKKKKKKPRDDVEPNTSLPKPLISALSSAPLNFGAPLSPSESHEAAPMDYVAQPSQKNPCRCSRMPLPSCQRF